MVSQKEEKKKEQRGAWACLSSYQAGCLSSGITKPVEAHVQSLSQPTVNLRPVTVLASLCEGL